MNAGGADSASVEPVALTRKRPNGVLLVRRRHVEAEIRTILDRPKADIRLRAQIQDESSPDYISAECLVYLAREAHRREDNALLRVLWTALSVRVWQYVESQLRTLRGQHAEDGAAKVTSDLGTLILNLDHDRGDFLQVSFWTTIKRRTIDEFKRQRRVAKKQQKLTSLDALPGEEAHSMPEGEDDGDFGGTLDWQSESATPLEQLERAELELLQQKETALKLAAVEEALATLPEPMRQAFILREKEGWQIESNNPNEPTIAVALSKTPRTIRNYLKEAKERLSKWREEAQ